MKAKFKKVFKFFKKPNLTFTLISYGLFVIFTILAIVFSCTNLSPITTYIMFGGMGISFFYCCYLFILFDFKKIKQGCKKVKEKLSSKSKFLNRLFNDIYFRTILATSFSLFLGVCFVGYNAFAGIYYHSIWNGSISVYYAFLVQIRILFLIGEYKLSHNKDINDASQKQKRAKMLRLEGILLIFVNLALVAPVTLLATSQTNVILPMWVAITNACFTFYKTTVCIYSFIKTRKNNNLSVKGIKNLNLTSACISLLSLENTMIITFSEEIGHDMQILMILSAFVVMIVNMWVAISTLINGIKQVHKVTPPSQDKICN